MEELARDLRQVEGVEGAVIISKDGVVLASDMEGDPEKEGAVAVFVGNAANQIGEALALGALDRGVVIIGESKMLVLECPDYYLGLLLAERTSPTIIASRVESLF